ncbi:hypothetical protein [Clostridium chrysemydis]|nr:hypothetical protein [Clostridium chrysemydis]
MKNLLVKRISNKILEIAENKSNITGTAYSPFWFGYEIELNKKEKK